MAIENASIKASVFAGESLEIIVRLVKVGNRSRRKAFEVYEHIRKRPDVSRGAAEVLNPPVLVAQGTLVSVVGHSQR